MARNSIAAIHLSSDNTQNDVELGVMNEHTTTRKVIITTYNGFNLNVDSLFGCRLLHVLQ